MDRLEDDLCSTDPGSQDGSSMLYGEWASETSTRDETEDYMDEESGTASGTKVFGELA